MSKELIINIDYTLDKLGRMVFTKEYLLNRGLCCGNNCLNCPWKTEETKRKNKIK